MVKWIVRQSEICASLRVSAPTPPFVSTQWAGSIRTDSSKFLLMGTVVLTRVAVFHGRKVVTGNVYLQQICRWSVGRVFFENCCDPSSEKRKRALGQFHQVLNHKPFWSDLIFPTQANRHFYLQSVQRLVPRCAVIACLGVRVPAQ